MTLGSKKSKHWVLAFVLVGCAGAPRGAHPNLASSAGLPAVAGVWEGLSQDTLSDGVGAGDTRIERQAWQLRQVGSAITGYLVTELTMVSGDGRPYLCSHEPRFSTLIRFEVQGVVGPGGVRLEQVGEAMAKGPCRPTHATRASYRAEVRGDILTLADGERTLTLYRRQGEQAAAATKQLLAFTRPDQTWAGEPAFPAGGPGSLDVERARDLAQTVDVGGVWVWEHRGRLPSGDEKREREEWHLEQTGNRLSGYYDRIVRQTSTDGKAYVCSNDVNFKVVTRYRLAGEVKGSRVVLYERSFEILEASPCDTGQRRLDAYEGEAALDELRLMWGVGAQVLRRDREDLPTMIF